MWDSCGTYSGEAAATWFTGTIALVLALMLYRLQRRSLFTDVDRKRIDDLIELLRQYYTQPAIALFGVDSRIDQMDKLDAIIGPASLRASRKLNRALEKAMLLAWDLIEKVHKSEAYSPEVEALAVHVLRLEDLVRREVYGRPPKIPRWKGRRRQYLRLYRGQNEGC